MRESGELWLPALEVTQGPGRVLYTFAVDGKTLPRFAAVSRIRRVDEQTIEGYQRAEVISHIQEIRTYLETPSPMIPNAVVVAFDSRIRFQPFEVQLHGSDYSRLGILVVPVSDGWTEDEKPGWVVDGQQRIAAIRTARIDSFPVCVTAFVAASDREQREQFILVNSTKPLPKALIYELLPTTKARLPSLYHRRRFPARLLERLNHDADSPFRHLILTPTNPGGIVKDNSVLRMLENSLADGALYRFRDAWTGEADEGGMLWVLKSFWQAASEVFPQAWGLNPRHSRLMHGAGIVSMGLIMDAIADRYRSERAPTVEQFRNDLEPLRDACRWTDGYWDFGPGAQRKWNHVQNTSKDIQLLSNYLLVQYRTRVWDRVSRGRAELAGGAA